MRFTPAILLRATSLVLLPLAVVFAGAKASAHPLVEEGIRKYEEADFAGAIEAFDRAEKSNSLSRGELVDIIVNRALVYFATNDKTQMRGDLVRLATLDPNYPLQSVVPPAVRKVFDEVRRNVREPIQVDVATKTVPGGVRFVLRVNGDAGNLVERVRLAARSGAATWQTAAKEELYLPASEGVDVEYYAQAIGPGGAVLAAVGSANTPRHVTVGAVGANDTQVGAANPLSDTQQSSKDDDSTWVWLAVGGGAVAAAVAVAAVLLLGGESQSDETVVSPPTIVTN